MPADLRTIPGVELVKVGRWEISTGPWNVTPSIIAAAKAAFDSGAAPRPVLKFGHVDPRYDGSPAVGYVDNLRIVDDGRTLVGDYVGVPAAVAEILASAYPRRSVEGIHDLVLADGTTHDFVVTAVALLGSTDAGIGSLSDIHSLYGVAASAGTRVALVHRAAPTLDNLSSRQRATVRAAATRRRHRTAAQALRIHESS